MLNLNLGQTWKGDDILMGRMARAWLRMEELTLTMPVEHFTISLKVFLFVLAAWDHLKLFTPGIDICSTIVASSSLRRPNQTLQRIALAPSEDIPDGYDIVPLGDFLRAACPSVSCYEDESWSAGRRSRLTEERMEEITE